MDGIFKMYENRLKNSLGIYNSIFKNLFPLEQIKHTLPQLNHPASISNFPICQMGSAIGHLYNFRFELNFPAIILPNSTIQIFKGIGNYNSLYGWWIKFSETKDILEKTGWLPYNDTVFLEKHPLTLAVLSLTVAKVDSMGLLVLKCRQCSAGKS